MNSIYAAYFIVELANVFTDVGARYNTQLHGLFHGDGSSKAFTFDQQNRKLGYTRFLCQVLMLITTMLDQFESDKDSGMNLKDIVGNVVEHHGKNVSRKADQYFRKKMMECAKKAYSEVSRMDDLKERGWK